MQIFLTICCKEKDPSPGNLPAIKRYLSDRISNVYQASIKQNTPMRIMSGEFGLLRPEDPIPYYDHLLSFNEVSKLSLRVIEQLQRDAVSSITFYAQPRLTLGWEPYYQLIEQSCQTLGIKLEVEVV